MNITGMDPWKAAVKSFGSDRNFLQFNCLSIAFESKGMIFKFLYIDQKNNNCWVASSYGIQACHIAKNDNQWRPWCLDVEFQCLNPKCLGQSWGMPWQDNGNHNAKCQVYNACGQRSKWVKYDTVEGKYMNLLFHDVYWTPWPFQWN